MKKFLSVAALLLFGVLLVPVARAQTEPSTPATTPAFLSWEHTLTTRTSQSRQAVAKLKIYNNWTPSRHRLLVKYNVLGLSAAKDLASRPYGPAFSMPTFYSGPLLSRMAYHHGALGLVTRLDDDKLIAYSSEAGEHGEYFAEPRRALLKRLRFDPWKKLAPPLSREEPPSLTLEQRRRLGREVRSVLRPMLKKVFKGYFKRLPETRSFTVNGEEIVARGYRMTWLLNAGNEGAGAQWMRLNFEWWLAGDTPSDAVLRQYVGAWLRDRRECSGPTTSMWLNELLPIMWQTMPQSLHQAVATFWLQSAPEAGSLPALAGAPVYFAMTITPPASRRRNDPVGTVRLEGQLTARSTRPLEAALFDAPPQYEKESLEPILKQWDEGQEMLQTLLGGDSLFADAAVPRTTGGGDYSWRALQNYLRAAQSVR